MITSCPYDSKKTYGVLQCLKSIDLLCPVASSFWTIIFTNFGPDTISSYFLAQDVIKIAILSLTKVGKRDHGRFWKISESKLDTVFL